MDVLPIDAEVAIDHVGLSAGDAMPHRANAADDPRDARGKHNGNAARWETAVARCALSALLH